MSKAEGVRRIGTLIRVAGLLWLIGFLIATAIGITHAIKEASAANEMHAAAQASLEKLTDAELLALYEQTKNNRPTPPIDLSPWYSRETAHIAFMCAVIGILGALSAYAFAWVLDGFAAPAKP